MKFAIVNGSRKEPTPKSTGLCPVCQHEMIAKCGKIKVWHWAHSKKDHCDNWWEPETEWHRNWKTFFPEESTEVIIERAGIKHIADIFYSGQVIELQNSPINSETIEAREKFYGDSMIWIVNGEKFQRRFEIDGFHTTPFYSSGLAILPDTLRDNLEIIEIGFKKYQIKGISSFEPTLVRDLEKSFHLFDSDDTRYRFASDIKVEFISDHLKKFDINYSKEHFFWHDRPKKTWQSSNRTVYIDFNNDWLFETKEFGKGSGYGRPIHKQRFLQSLLK